MKKIIIALLPILFSCSNEQRTSNGIDFLKSEKVVQKKCELVNSLHGAKIMYIDIFEDCVTVKDKDEKVFVVHINSDLVSAMRFSEEEIIRLPNLDCSQVISIE